MGIEKPLWVLLNADSAIVDPMFHSWYGFW